MHLDPVVGASVLVDYERLLHLYKLAREKLGEKQGTIAKRAELDRQFSSAFPFFPLGTSVSVSPSPVGTLV